MNENFREKSCRQFLYWRARTLKFDLLSQFWRWLWSASQFISASKTGFFLPFLLWQASKRIAFDIFLSNFGFLYNGTFRFRLDGPESKQERRANECQSSEYSGPFGSWSVLEKSWKGNSTKVRKSRQIKVENNCHVLMSLSFHENWILFTFFKVRKIREIRVRATI